MTQAIESGVGDVWQTKQAVVRHNRAHRHHPQASPQDR
jgi:hypothetical protein